MRRRALLGWLALAGVLPVASCDCSGGTKGDAPEGAGSVTATPAPPPKLVSRTFHLDNGLEVDLATGPCGERLGLALLLSLGIDHDPDGRSGMVQVVAEVLKGAAGASPHQPKVELGEAFTLYTATPPADALPKELEAIAAWLAHEPSAEDLERAKKAVLEAIAARDGGDPAAMARSFAEESLLPTRNQGKRLGLRDEVEAITLEELQAFFAAHVAAGNARLVLAGARDGAAVEAAVRKALGALPKGTPPEAGQAAPATVKGTLVMGDAPSAIAIAVPAPEMTSPVFPAFLVLAARLLAAESPRFAVGYDPLLRPELLFITGSVPEGRQPEPSAEVIRGDVAKLLEAPFGDEDRTRTEARFPLLLAPDLLDPAVCKPDPRAYAVARARRGAIKGVTLEGVAEGLDEARALFGPTGSAAVIAGGKLPAPLEPKDD